MLCFSRKTCWHGYGSFEVCTTHSDFKFPTLDTEASQIDVVWVPNFTFPSPFSELEVNELNC